MAACYEVMDKWSRRSIFGCGGDHAIEVGDHVVVEVEGRQTFAEVIWKGEDDEGEEDLDLAIRIATKEDVTHFTGRRQNEIEALEVFTNKIAEHQLPMKPVDVEFEDDRSRVTFYFTAENRVDFRALVRDLARVYRTRIELRQINLRQAVQRLGEYGTCGRQLCCTCFMHKVPPVPANAAQDQFVSQNPAKLSGVCGQLKCCLRYELDFYRDSKQRLDGARTKHNCPHEKEAEPSDDD
jgi:cell fate regulator YaaT (PSP1 superfamily)